MLLNLFLKKLPFIKPVEKQQKTIEGILVHVLKRMVTQKTQVVSSNLFVLAREISDLIPRITSALRSFPIYLNLDFSQLLDTQGKMLKFRINAQKDLAKLLNVLLDLPFHWVPITSIFRSSDIGFLSWM